MYLLKKIILDTAKGIRQLCLELLAHILHANLTASLDVPCKVNLKATPAMPQNKEMGWVSSHTRESNRDTNPFPSILS